MDDTLEILSSDNKRYIYTIRSEEPISIDAEMIFSSSNPRIYISKWASLTDISDDLTGYDFEMEELEIGQEYGKSAIQMGGENKAVIDLSNEPELPNISPYL